MPAIGVDTVEATTIINPDVVMPTNLIRPPGWGPLLTGQKRCPRLGGMVDWQGMSGPHGTFLTWVPDTRELSLRLSIPRLAYPYGSASANTPLRPYRPETFRDICRDVLYAMGIRLSSIGVDHTARLGIMDWAVKKCAFAADVEVTDIVEACRSLASLERKHSKEAHCWVNKGIITGLEWQTADHRFQLYDKRAELLARKKAPNKDEQALVRGLAANMEDTIRLEATCLTSRGVRDLLGLSSPSLPTLRRILEADIASYALGKELHRLGLLSLSKVSRARGRESRALGMEFLMAKVRLEESGEQLGRHSKLSGSRLMQLIGYYQMCRDFSRDELKSKFGVSDSTRREFESDLKGLGVPPILRKSRTNREALAEIVHALRPLVTLKRPVLTLEDLGGTSWAGGDEEDETSPSAAATAVSTTDFSYLIENVIDNEPLAANGMVVDADTGDLGLDDTVGLDYEPAAFSR